MKKLIRYFFQALGLEIRRVNPVNDAPKKAFKLSDSTMEAAMFRLQNLGIKPSTVIDLGAAAGTWTLKAEKYFPGSAFMLFEPLEERKMELTALAAAHKNFIPVFAAAGAQPGKIRFTISKDLDGSGVYDKEKGGESREVEQVTIDQSVRSLKLTAPFLLKFDTHGFEVPILEGAAETLKQTEAVIMECYGFRLSGSSLLIHEMIAHMENLGFRLCDVVDLMRRPSDAAFWQCDLVFLKDSHPVFKSNTYS